MELNEAIQLIDKSEIDNNVSYQQWADLGCGDGLFTNALAHLLPAPATIFAIDKYVPKLVSSVKDISIQNRTIDFIKEQILVPALDGIIMANSFHYVEDKKALIKKLKTILKPNHRLIIVEYDTDQPVKTWVPFPISYKNVKTLFQQAGYNIITKLNERPSVYGRANMYASFIAP